MGIFRAGIVFSLGAVWGMYVAQNYRVPDVQSVLDACISNARTIEETHRKNHDTSTNKEKPET